METRKVCNRIPVIYRNKPLMPTKWRRAKRLVKLGLAKIKYNKDGIMYCKLLYKPSGEKLQAISLGIDPGTHFDGFSIVSHKYHHENLELIHNKGVKDRMQRRSMYRRIRRSRLWHRRARFDHRTASKLVPTIFSMVEFRIDTLNRLLKLYPICRVVIEDVAYNHYGDSSGIGSYFSQCEIGKNKFYSYIKSLGLDLIKAKGYETKQVRIELFNEDLKISNKAKRDFFAHCLDSFALANMDLGYSGKCITSTRFISKIWLNRRELFKLKARTGDNKYGRRYVKSGFSPKSEEEVNNFRVLVTWNNGKRYEHKVILFDKVGKPYKTRTKTSVAPSNHGPWDYLYFNGATECTKSYLARYGGTVVRGQSRVALPRGKSKRCIWSKLLNTNLGFRNRRYDI